METLKLFDSDSRSKPDLFEIDCVYSSVNIGLLLPLSII